jgi:hypothetical protein
MGEHVARRIKLIEGDAKSLRLKSKLEKVIAAAIYFCDAPSPPKLLSWGGQQFCRILIWSHPECKSPE